MKRGALLFLIAALILSAALCGCGPAEQDGNIAEQDGNIAEQIAVLAENSGIWMPDEETMEYSRVMACVTDLDRNGRLEIVLEHMEGTGCFSYIDMYEVTEDLAGISRVDLSVFEETSEPDFDRNSLRVYIEDGICYYLCQDFIANGYAERCVVNDYFWLEDGCLGLGSTGSFMASAGGHGYMAEPDESKVFLFLYGAEGMNVSEEGFAQLEEERFGGAEKTAATFGWFALAEADDMPAALTESYAAFGFDPSIDDGEFNWVGPYDLYTDLTPVIVSGTGDDGMGEDL